ncbi:MAG: glycosyltransferase [Thermodesulfobacteriota bacterium]|nr:glycosyltransferase [Thermodesulfobacteriota bacterium]
MKIIQINSVCGVGSHGRIATNLHNILAEQGHESYIAFGRDKPQGCDSTIKIGNKISNYFHVALTRFFDWHGFGSKQSTQRFITQLNELSPDIIHLHNIHGYYINIKILFEYLKQKKIPVVWTLHDCWAFTGHCSYFDYVSCSRWKTFCHNCPQKKEYPASLLFDNSRKNFFKKKELFTGIKNMTLVTPSHWLAGLVKKSFLSEYDVKVVNNGIDLELFKPRKSHFRKRYGLNEKFIILGVANIWEKRKGLKYFIKLSQKLINDQVIVIVGLDKKQQKRLPDNIVGIKKVENAYKLSEIYAAADVFMNTTLEEVLGLVNIEALACGIPVITFETGGSVECVDQDTGAIAEKGNIDDLAYKINELRLRLNNDPYVREKCLARAKRLYDKNSKSNEYLAIYNDIIKNPQPTNGRDKC